MVRKLASESNSDGTSRVTISGYTTMGLVVPVSDSVYRVVLDDHATGQQTNVTTAPAAHEATELAKQALLARAKEDGLDDLDGLVEVSD